MLLKKNLAVCRLFSILAFIAIIFSGCGPEKNAPPPPSERKSDEPLRILTSFFPMYVMTQNIAGNIDGVEIANLTSPTVGCLHDYQLTTGDMKKIMAADIFIANGGGAENFLAKALAANKKIALVIATDGLPLLPAKENNHHHPENAAAETNPHVWLSISLARKETANIAKNLARLDPAHASAYEKNAASYDKKLAALESYAAEKLKALSPLDIVTFHDAFPYFAKEYGLNVVLSIEREPGQEPSPRELTDIIAKLKEIPRPLLCIEPQYPTDAARTIAREIKAPIVTLDPCVTGESSPNAAVSYLLTMRKNIDTLHEAATRR